MDCEACKVKHYFVANRTWCKHWTLKAGKSLPGKGFVGINLQKAAGQQWALNHVMSTVAATSEQ